MNDGNLLETYGNHPNPKGWGFRHARFSLRGGGNYGNPFQIRISTIPSDANPEPVGARKAGE